MSASPETPAHPGGFLRRNLTRIVALALVAALYGFAREPALSGPERRALAGRFAFIKTPFAVPPGDLSRTVRRVHPDFRQISVWVSGVVSIRG
jgi:hypothetical protein